jgi:hypothetical protein
MFDVQKSLSFVILLIVLSIGPSVSAAEHSQSFRGIKLTQSSSPGCVGLKLFYDGQISWERKVQVYIDLNGSKGIFDLERNGSLYELSMTSCPAACAIQNVSCLKNQSLQRRLFYWAMTNGKPSPWFVQLAFITGTSAPTGSSDNYKFIFP